MLLMAGLVAFSSCDNEELKSTSVFEDVTQEQLGGAGVHDDIHRGVRVCRGGKQEQERQQDIRNTFHIIQPPVTDMESITGS